MQGSSSSSKWEINKAVASLTAVASANWAFRSLESLFLDFVSERGPFEKEREE